MYPLAHTQISTPKMESTTKAPAASGMGWSKGMACQVRLPNTSVLLWCHRTRSFAGRKSLHHDRIEETGLDRPIGVGLDVLALLQQVAVARLIEHRTGGARRRGPCREFLGRDCPQVKCHVGEAIAAELRREARIDARSIGLQVELSRHTV